MLKVGLTGGIGSGKSTVAGIFSTLGVPVLDADKTAKYLMETDKELQKSIQKIFGEESYQDDRLNRSFLANIVFNDSEKLAQLNALVHPATIAFGKKWTQSQTAPYVIKEAALFFESESYQDIDFMIGVSAPESLRIKRIKIRDGLSEKEIKARIGKQMNEQEKMSKCDAVILNDEQHSVTEQVWKLHQKLLKLSGSENYFF